jgi:hypothetical protein
VKRIVILIGEYQILREVGIQVLINPQFRNGILGLER